MDHFLMIFSNKKIKISGRIKIMRCAGDGQYPSQISTQKPL